jgi:hypothetical protein
MTHMKRHLVTAIAASAAILATATADTRETARKLSASHGESIVWLTVLAKTSMSAEGDVPAQIKSALAAQEKEERSEITATVIDASGMLVTALGGLDKSSMVDGQSIRTPMGDIKVIAKAEIKEIKVIMADGTEIPADLVLKDEDLGLAFVKVRADSEEAKGVTFSPVNLADSAPAKLLDPCIMLSRMDEGFNREPSAMTGEVTGVTTRPRVFYRASGDAIGCPVFLEDGKMLGISVLRNLKGAAAASGRIQVSPVVLPAADIAKIAEQAKDAEPIPTESADDESDADAPGDGE